MPSIAQGLLQTDGYAAYDRVGGEKMVHAACWSHAKRYFVDAVKLNKQDAASIRAVELMNELFAIDAQARNEKMDHAARYALRHEKAPPLLDEIRTHILDMSKTVLPSSAAGQAYRYTLAIWQKVDLLPRLSRTGARQQPCGELHAAYRFRQRQLDPHRKRNRRTARGRYHLRDRKLPPP
jgi:hypothetical protein